MWGTAPKEHETDPPTHKKGEPRRPHYRPHRWETKPRPEGGGTPKTALRCAGLWGTDPIPPPPPPIGSVQGDDVGSAGGGRSAAHPAAVPQCGAPRGGEETAQRVRGPQGGDDGAAAALPGEHRVTATARTPYQGPHSADPTARTPHH